MDSYHAFTEFPVEQSEFILGEYPRTLDERYRLSIPESMSDLLTGGEPKDCVLAKERPGCLSLWSCDVWEKKLDDGVNVIKEKIRAGLMDGRIGQVQMFGRLLSTRNTTVQLAGRGRLLIPDRFRPFLGVEPGHEVVVVGASVCIELWNPTRWYEYLDEQIPAFRQLFDTLAQ